MSREADWEAVQAAVLEVYTPEGADIWLHNRNRLLGNEVPADLVDAGDGQRVLNLLQALAEGVFF